MKTHSSLFLFCGLGGGAPLQLDGANIGGWLEQIGNAVPVGAAKAIAEQMLFTLASSDIGAGLLPSGGAVWVSHGFDKDICYGHTA